MNLPENLNQLLKDEAPQYNGKKCKEECNCIKIAEIKNGGPVKSYQCLKQDNYDLLKTKVEECVNLDNLNIPAKPDLPKAHKNLIDKLRYIHNERIATIKMTDQDMAAFVTKICDLQDFLIAHAARDIFQDLK